ncbi:hypothetical protein QBC35DRAFT_385635 [Podospora australis]|uniref:Uncharacterized protein n=1 Tax=Podospora australis TaxID=1536484 RepID=A0AAN6WV93_9PEZI|nr:hypothetical protein QBC35DRAFT_385635 [Podospora australis]
MQSVSSTVKDNVYPGVYGPDGLLTTETEAFSRTVLPTRVSIAPNPGTDRAPPPMDIPSSSSPVPVAAGPTPPPLPQRPGGPPPLPNGPPPLPTMSSVEVISEGLTSYNFGKTEEASFNFGKPEATSSSSFTGYHNSSGFYPNQTHTVFSPTTTTSSMRFCQASDYTTTRTAWSIVYTSTITWYGNPEDYTPPYAPISTPDTGSSCIDIMSPPKFTVSVCTSTGTGSKAVTCDVSVSTSSWNYGFQSTIRTAPSTITFLTTDKNPAVVYSTIKTPNYGVSQPPKTLSQYVTATNEGNNPGGVYNPGSGSGSGSGNNPLPMSQPPAPAPSPITVGIKPTAVVINDNTIIDTPSKPTQVVVVSGETFTIDPTRVIGAGAIIDRPLATGGGVFIPTPTTTTVDGVPIFLSSSVAVIGSSTFTFTPQATSTVVAVIDGRTFTVGPTAIAVASHTINLPTAPLPTEVVVVGGELVTAIGPTLAVIRGTTITYGGTSQGVMTTTVDDDIITLGPGGVTVHGTITLGGPGARPSATEFAVAGGATLTKIGASVIVIKSTTYTIGPLVTGTAGVTGTITTVVGGETITIMPDGVVVSTLSMGYPFGPTTVILPGAGVTAASSTAGATAGIGSGGEGGEEGEEDAAGSVRPGVMAAVGWALVGVVVVWVG